MEQQEKNIIEAGKEQNNENNEEILSLRQERYCELFTSPDKDFFGNGAQAYLDVYDINRSNPNWYKTACACASRLLSYAKVINRINELLENQGFTDENVEKQHLFLLNQFTDLKTKMKAIDSYYKLKGKNEPEKIEVKNDLTRLTDEELIKLTRSREGISEEGISEEKA